MSCRMRLRSSSRFEPSETRYSLMERKPCRCTRWSTHSARASMIGAVEAISAIGDIAPAQPVMHPQTQAQGDHGQTRTDAPRGQGGWRAVHDHRTHQADEVVERIER